LSKQSKRVYTAEKVKEELVP